MHCRQCSYALYRSSARTSARKIYYYRCSGSDAYRHGGKAIYDQKPIRQDLLDQLVWDEILRLLEDPTLIQNKFDATPGIGFQQIAEIIGQLGFR